MAVRAGVALCIECKARPKVKPQHRCSVCLLKRQPIGDQVEAADRRRGMIPPALVPRTVPKEYWPPGQRWCGGCLSFVDLSSCGGTARCHPCRSRATHERYIKATYGIDLDEYNRLVTVQGGRCAICRARPVSERLAVDHDHASGAVRGLLCSRCNHSLLGAAHDSLAILRNAVSYLEATPRSGTWTAPLPTPAQARTLTLHELNQLWALVEEGARECPF